MVRKAAGCKWRGVSRNGHKPSLCATSVLLIWCSTEQARASVHKYLSIETSSSVEFLR